VPRRRNAATIASVWFGDHWTRQAFGVIKRRDAIPILTRFTFTRRGLTFGNFPFNS
jgi:hypothetical protein